MGRQWARKWAGKGLRWNPPKLLRERVKQSTIGTSIANLQPEPAADLFNLDSADSTAARCDKDNLSVSRPHASPSAIEHRLPNTNAQNDSQSSTQSQQNELRVSL